MNAMPDADVIHLPLPVLRPVQSPPPLHSFGDAKSVPPHRTPTRRWQTERTCNACGAVKVTIHGTNSAKRAWRKTAYAEQVETDVAPACEPIFGAAV